MSTKIGGFEQFVSPSNTRLVDSISITKNSQFNFPTAMYNINKLEGFKAVRLYLNKKDNQIGIEFLSEQEDGDFKLIPSGENARYGAYMVAKSFFIINKLKPEKLAGRYDYSKVSLKKLGSERPGFMYVLDLNKKEDKV